MNLDELRSIQSAERESDALQHLRDGFYRDAGEYVDQLREQRRAAAEDAVDPYGDAEVRRLTDEIETAKAVTEAIWEARIGKILRVAGLSATDMSASAEGLTPEEAALFERVVEAIETNRETIQGALETTESAPPGTDGSAPPGADGSAPPGADGSAPPGADGSAPSSTDHGQIAQGDREGDGSTPDEHPPVPPEEPNASHSRPAVSGTDGATPAGEQHEPSGTPGTARDEEPTDSDGPAETTDQDQPASPDTAAEEDPNSSPDGGRVRVRITQDVGTIAGVDGREYHLAADDVAELPDANARPLLERDAAQRLE